MRAAGTRQFQQPLAYAGGYRPIPQKQVSSSPTARSTAPGRRSTTKAFAILVDQEGDNYKVSADEQLNVDLSDVNGKEVARQERSEDQRLRFLQRQLHGPARPAHGPDDDPGRPDPAATPVINVEEYKRPKFQVTLDLPQDGRPAGRRGAA
jgi:hypothetical protein